MGADVPISILLEKLKDLEEERFIFPGLRNVVRIAVEELEKTLSNLNAEEETRSSSSRLLEAPLLPTVNSPEVTSLLRSVYSAEYTIETFLLKTVIKPPLMAFPIPPWTELQFSSKLKKIVKGFKDVRSKLRPHKHDPENNYTTHKVDDDTRRYDDEPDDDELVGREDGEEKKLVDRLIDDNNKSLRVISLVSEEALGKTALARKVYNRLDIRQHFKRRAWLHVPQNFEKKDLKDLLIVILKQITIGVLKDVELMSENEMSALLFKSLMELRFLVVLDDVCTDDVWLMFVRPFADALNGSRVILTTRDSNLASNVDPWSHPLNLVPLTKEDAWALFKKKFAVGRHRPRPENKTNYNNSVQLDNFREHILEICGGLPPAILLLGGLLSTIELNEWSNLIDQIEYLRECQSSLLNIIALLSYHKLRSELKLCFLYLALFPKANEISARRLLQLWIAEGFVKMSSTQGSEQPEDVARKYLEELKCRNMIEIVTRKKDGRPKTCRMPSFLHDFFMPKAKDIGFIHAHRCKSDCTEHQCSSDVCFKAQERGTFNREIDTLLKTIINRRRSRGCVLMKVLDLEGAYRPFATWETCQVLEQLKVCKLAMDLSRLMSRVYRRSTVPGNFRFEVY